MTTDVPRLAPWPGPINQEHYDGLKRHELLLQKCSDCGKFRWWPIEMCPFCNSFNFDWTRCSGKGTVHSYTIQHATMPYPWPVLTAGTGSVTIRTDGTTLHACKNAGT